MRRHLVIHFSGTQSVRVTNPVYRCSICTFRSKWQFFVKKHITTHHLSVRNAYVLRYNAKPGKADQIKIKPEIEDSASNDGNGIGQEEVQIEDEMSIEHEENIVDENQLINDQLVENECHSDIDFDNNTENKKIETLNLTGHDGQSFQASYCVTGLSASQLLEPEAPLSPMANRKKGYHCQTCPYTTKTYNNIRQHLLNHHFVPEHVKCRYCEFYVSHQRLLKAHEAIHPEFEELPEHSALKRNSSVGLTKPMLHA